MRAAKDFWDYLRTATPARIALGRAGDGLPTSRLLEFELAHARARDAVWAGLDSGALLAELAVWQPVVVHSAAPDRVTFLQRPDLGRRLSQESQRVLSRGSYGATIIIADGLSAAAIGAQAAPLCKYASCGAKFCLCPARGGSSGARCLGGRSCGKAGGGARRRPYRGAPRPFIL